MGEYPRLKQMFSGSPPNQPIDMAGVSSLFFGMSVRGIDKHYQVLVSMCYILKSVFMTRVYSKLLGENLVTRQFCWGIWCWPNCDIFCITFITNDYFALHLYYYNNYYYH